MHGDVLQKITGVGLPIAIRLVLVAIGLRAAWGGDVQIGKSCVGEVAQKQILKISSCTTRVVCGHPQWFLLLNHLERGASMPANMERIWAVSFCRGDID